MYSVWHCVRARKKTSNFTARCVLKVWHITRFNSNHRPISYDIMNITIIKHVLPAPLSETSAFMSGRPSWQPQHCSALSHVLEYLQRPREVYRPTAFDFGGSSSSFMLIIAIQYRQERLLLIAFIGKFCNSRFCDGCAACCRDQTQ